MLSGQLAQPAGSWALPLKLIIDDEKKIATNNIISDTIDSNSTAVPARAKSNVSYMLGNGKERTVLPSTFSDTATNLTSTSEASERSSALELAYVHDVYENCEETIAPVRPRVAQFIAGLDPGSVVCDVGCGNGKYLNSCNPHVSSIGVDRCYRLTRQAKIKGGEVALCDNLELPFRDESFDAVLSLAVVHHFATTERRVSAIRELARVLRIGGRVVITVWAFEQRHRRFESQDVLIPWQPPKIRTQNFSDDDEDEDFLPPYHAYTEDSTNSSRSAGDGDSSSLSSSSPGESCYSFVRRAIQKLAGGRKHPWFLDSWQSKDNKTESSLDFEDAKDLPIELRRLEDFEDFPEPPLSAGLKSRSLGSILNPPPRQIVRSRSSVPSLGIASDLKTAQTGQSGKIAAALTTSPILNTKSGTASTSFSASILNSSANSMAPPSSTRRPKLVKQKQSLCDEDNQTVDPISPASDLGKPSLGSNSDHLKKNDGKIFLRKQSSLNEDLMAENRLREKDKVRKRIQKQMSLNEAFLCRSVFTKRLQIIREGISTKFKNSTGSFERVTKNSLVKIMHNIKSNQFRGQQSKDTLHQANRKNSFQASKKPDPSSPVLKVVASSENDSEEKPRRHSRESGSDSSKDSSLQSDTSIESEDSFASVIYVPKPEQKSQQQVAASMISNSNSKLVIAHKIPSLPTSPLIMPCPPTPAHSPAASASVTSSNNLVPKLSTPHAHSEKYNSSSAHGDRKLNNCFTFEDDHILQQENLITKVRAHSLKKRPEKITRQTVEDLPPIPKFRKQQLSHNSSSKAVFPMVRRTSMAPSVPKLHSLEIFNPETDDLDSDSSEPSSPDSIDSVISALKPEQIVKTDVIPSEKNSCNSSKILLKGAEENIEDNISESTGITTLKESLVYNFEDNLQINRADVSQNTQSKSNLSSSENFIQFAEHLSAHLQKEINESKIDNSVIDTTDILQKCKQTINDDVCYGGENRDLCSLREELRERRLRLANLRTTVSTASSTSSSSLTSQGTNNTKTSTIHEEDESSASILKFEYTSQHLASCNVYNSLPDTACLIQHDANSSMEDDEDNFEEIDHDVILEEEEDDIYETLIESGVSKGSEAKSRETISQQQVLDQTESWRHSNSTNSLDSLSHGGGSTTHHRYYHVFREGELDALINHHVASLHIVSSYYERASWCVVAEKVQVWTI